MPQTNEKWWEEEKYWVQEADGSSVYPYENVYKLKRQQNIQAIVSEAERRGYERAMKEAREAVIPTVDTLTLYSRQGQEETIDVYYIPKSFFEK